MELLTIFLIPLLAAVASLLPLGKSRFPAGVTLAGTLTVFIISLHTVFTLGPAAGRGVPGVYSWIFCDSLSGLILLLISFVGLAASIFSWGYIGAEAEGKNPAKIRRYYAFYNLFLLSMLAVPLISHVAIVWIAVELTTLMSVFLVSFEDTPEALEAAWKYVVLTCIGAAFALVGILILYRGMRLGGADTFTWAGLLSAAPKIPPAYVETAFLFILMGFGTKVGLVPLHTWLPDAHSQAPSPVCALLSGVETTTALYVILRLLPLFQGIHGNLASRWFVIIGLVSVGVAAFLLLQVRDYKRLFAFSTIEHMGIILVAAGLSGLAVHLGATLQIMAHAVTKSFCFFAAGAALLMTGTRDIASVRGLIRTSPAAGISLMLGGLAIAGAPPFVVFLSEFSIIRAGIMSRHPWVIGLLAIFIVIAFCGIMYRINKMVFGIPIAPPKRPVFPFSCKLALGLAVIPVILFGVYIPHALYNLLHFAALSLGR